MSFTSGGIAYAENHKQHLNLSTQAYEVIQNDVFTFGEARLSSFINRVFEQYAPVAEASVSRALNRRGDELSRLFERIKGDEKTKEQVRKALLQRAKDCLVERALSYEKGRAFKFWLNKKNLIYLTEAESECNEEKYYGDHRGKYIKSVLEEYARLPYVQREKVYFSPFVEEIESAVREQHQLRIKTGWNKVYSVYPYGILCDPLSTANYLVGYSKRYSHPEDDLRPCSFRISALNSIREEKSKGAFLSGEKRKLLAQTIASRGVQFMSSEDEEIQVRLTSGGQAKYQRQVHLRPTLVRRTGPQEDIFVFQCTAAQAEFYFFKFGADAEILQPSDLRKRFIALHTNALNAYHATEQKPLELPDGGSE